ncbi:hypothetical protein Q4E93_20160 [Flavitalea sp. BT771]|uniref:hypothetical protein n=1 Tax=Flavitalea sp. BT771 TaxID=3063329 RepID=UPI0026E2E7C0|nr:hypothetical protein [Flavitalea sp. BT771]MDO6432934.1 hypothetical protein [Flavitalea sp. BT771]MDV6221790.1 hypothetical protein [Flavitalea sp. BT771]
MTKLYDYIFARWVRAFDELGSLGKYRELVRTKKFATTYRYEIKDYTPQKFPAGGALYNEMPEDASNSRIYGFDQEGRPVHTSQVYGENGIPWEEGFYNYSENAVEYVEFSKNAGAPTRIQIMTLKNGKKTAFLQFIVQGIGNGVPGGNLQAFIEQTRISSDGIICHIEQYIYNGERIMGAHCFDITPGIDARSYEQVYTYDNEGEMDEIRNVYSGGHHRLAYVRVREGMSVEALVDGLSVLMADAVVGTLLRNNVEQPLALLELSYQGVIEYLPSLEFKTVADRDELIDEHGDAVDFELMFIPTYENMIVVENATFERPLQQLMQIMEQREDYDPGTKMLRKTAWLLTKGKLNGKIPVSDDFVAYAIEWMLESQEFEEILRDCGQSEEVIMNWKGKRWI